ncbi:MAG: chitobiase/beta-hexosaminidase C-terminal domain-containing protein [Puniceicoccales bacterium]|jgi:alpha-tubulin suppressor-like RCC1 family protein|nr:chitobiase/beta-hexosaminidase C-terminal domain-containing protein [Puniceicoccales bacterium]
MITPKSEGFLKRCRAVWLGLLAVASLLAPSRAPAAEVPLDRTVDVLVVYSKEVLAYHGSPEGVLAHVNLWVAQTNQAYENSQITAKIRLVGLEPLAYSDARTDYYDDLMAATGLDVYKQPLPSATSQTVAALREKTGADLVCFLRKGAVDGVAGLAWILRATGGERECGFSVVGTDMGVKAFAHELGHNMGCAHDRANSGAYYEGGGGLFPYSYGLYMSNGYGTIMSYPGREIMHFSNPNVSYGGVPTGIVEASVNSADNAKTINYSIAVLAAYSPWKPMAAAPRIVPNGGGPFTEQISVTIESDDPAATVRYTIDGSEVTENSDVYAGPFAMEFTGTVRARAYLAGDSIPSWPVTASFTFKYENTVGTPEIVPNGGSFRDGVDVHLSVATPEGATLRYTLDGRDVSVESPVYTGVLRLTAAHVDPQNKQVAVKVRAYKSLHNPSAQVKAVFKITSAPPTGAPRFEEEGDVIEGRRFNGPVEVWIVPSAQDAADATTTVRYTIDGSDVDVHSPIYALGLEETPVIIRESCTLKARVYRKDHQSGEQSDISFEIVPATMAIPGISPNGGNHVNFVTVAFSMASRFAQLRYTTNGDEVDEDSPLYNGPFTLYSSARVKVRGFGRGYAPGIQVENFFNMLTSEDVMQIGTHKLAAGGEHSLGICDGMLLAMGGGGYGQLGNGSVHSSNVPVLVALDVANVAAALNHTLYVTSSGGLWAFGRNEYGQLGLGDLVSRSTPAFVSGGVRLVAAGRYHSLFTKTDGTLWVVGRNSDGQLGLGTTGDRSVPVQVNVAVELPSDVSIPGANNVISVAAGAFHSLFVAGDGVLYAFGRNEFGQLGDGSNLSRKSPVPVRDGRNVIAVSAGDAHTLFLKNDGTVWAMGRNDFGQIGVNPLSQTLVPLQVGTDAVAIAAGLNHSVYVRGDGTAWAFGSNADGQLGDGTRIDRGAPVQVINTSGRPIVAVAAGDAHTLFTLDNGEQLSVGRNSSGQLGNGGTDGASTPGDVNAYAIVPPAISPVGGQYEDRVEVGIANAVADAGAVVRYTTDGADVSPASPEYTGAFVLTTADVSPVDNKVVVKARSYLGGVSSAQSSAEFTIVPAPVSIAPVIVSHPVSQTTLVVGSRVTLEVVASGTPAPTYQWFRNGVAIHGAIGTVYTIPSFSDALAGFYSVKARNAAGAVMSDLAELALSSIPELAPVSGQLNFEDGVATVAVGAALTLAVTEHPGAAYQWRRNGIAIPLAGSSSAYVVPQIFAADNGSWYDVIIITATGSVASTRVTLAVLRSDGAPQIVAGPSPANATRWETESITFTVGATGSTPLEYEWKRNGSTVRKTSVPTFTIDRLSVGDAGSYTVSVRNSHGVVTSGGTAVLEVRKAPELRITAQPQSSMESAIGGEVTFRVEAAVSGYTGLVLTYQWARNGVPIAGATDATHTIAHMGSEDAGRYTVVVGIAGTPFTVTSRESTLSILQPPKIKTLLPGSREVAAYAVRGATIGVVLEPGLESSYLWLDEQGDPAPGTNNAASYFAETPGKYKVRVTNAGGSIESEFITVNFVVPPKIAAFAASASTIVTGGEVTFTVVLRDGTGIGGALSYALYQSGNPKPIHVSDSPGFTLRVDRNASYYVVVTQTVPNFWTDTVRTVEKRVVVNDPVAIVSGLMNLELRPGQTGRLSVIATGSAPITYGWRKNGQLLPCETNVLTLPNVTIDDAGTYTVTVNNPVGNPVVSTSEVRIGAAAAMASASAASASGDFNLTVDEGVIRLGVRSEFPAPQGALSFEANPFAFALREGDRIVLEITEGSKGYGTLLEVLSSTRLANGTYTYAITGWNSARIDYVITGDDEETFRIETGGIGLVFSVAAPVLKNGDYAIKGSIKVVDAAGNLTETPFEGRGRFTIFPAGNSVPPVENEAK